MSIVASVRSQLVPINHEGYPFIAGFAIASLFLMWLWSPLGWLGVSPRCGASISSAIRRG